MSIEPSLLPLQRVYHWEAQRGGAVYLTQPMGGGALRHWTWAQAVDEARRVAAWLQGFGWPAGSRVAILSKNCAQWILSDLAIWMAGHVSVPLYPTLTAESVRQILEHSEARAVFVGKLDDWAAMKPGIPAGVECFRCALSPAEPYPAWEDIVARTAPIAGSPVRGAEELATLVYTSGTTGMPKGVMHTFGNIAWAAKSLADRFPTRPDDRMLSYLPLSHVAERWVVESGSIQGGFQVFFAESLDTFAEDLRRARPSFFISVPRLWVKFQQGVYAKIPQKKLDRLLRIPILSGIVRRKILQGMGLDQVRMAGGGAAPMPPVVLDFFNRLGIELLEGYGMTENFGCSHSSLSGRARVGYVGEPYPGVEHKLDVNGEVLMRSPALMKGYYKEPEKTREAITEDGWLRTGDLGEIDEMNRLRITGRAKELFKTSKGKYVAPAPIENKLTAHGAVEACCVTGANFPQPFALVMASQAALDAAREPAGRAALVTSLAEHLASVNASLDAHEQLDFLAVVSDQWTVENGLITPTLKVKRNVVEKRYEPQYERWARARQPVVWAA
ncbi:MAG TPA: AMP-binding protein [Nevskiaceae bacterium]|nr:AMP-binding protein [Nevskiaceae bacterium]